MSDRYALGTCIALTFAASGIIAIIFFAHLAAKLDKLQAQLTTIERKLP